MQVSTGAYDVTATFRLTNKPASALWEWSRVEEVEVTAQAMLPSSSVISFTLGNGLVSNEAQGGEGACAGSPQCVHGCVRPPACSFSHCMHGMPSLLQMQSFVTFVSTVPISARRTGAITLEGAVGCRACQASTDHRDAPHLCA